MTSKDVTDERVKRAIGASFLADVPPSTTAHLVSDAVLLDVPAGGIVYRDEDAPRSALVVAGLVRVYLSSAEGRQLTVRYARPGAALGVPTAIRGPVRVGAQAVTDSALLMFSATRLATVAAQDVRVAWPLAQEVTGLLYGVLDAFAGTAFGSVRQRLARHLLDLATSRQRGVRLMATISQQGLADAVGTAREVVARTLHDFRAAGLIETSRRGIVLLDPDRIESLASTGEL
jgi:CRP/FNR family cyclic AMP-dependent transcriptional regulator